jgi:hypothetical protein
VLTVLNQKDDARNGISTPVQGLIVIVGDAWEREWISSFREELSPFQVKEYKRYFKVSLLSAEQSVPS